MQHSDHRYLRWILDGEALRVLALYAANADPTAEDDRWGGYALYLSGQHLQARDRLARAVARGCPSAGIELATVYRHLGESALARSILDAVPQTELGPFDAALTRRESAILLTAEGRLDQATQRLEQLWGQVQDGPTALRSSVGLALGWAHAQAGQDQRAIHVLDLAVDMKVGPQRAQALATRGMSLVYAGHFERAALDFVEARSYLHSLPALAPTLAYCEGVLRRAQGRYGEAVDALQEAVHLAGVEGEVCFFAELALCALFSALARPQEASAALARASRHTGEDRRALYWAWRSAALDARRGYPRPAALDDTRRGFAALGLRREEGWVTLELAEHFAQEGQYEELESALNHVTDLRHALGSGAAFALELRDHPQVLQYLRLHPDTYSRVLLDDMRLRQDCAPLEITVLTIGSMQLLADGMPVSLRLRRGIEVLAYLLDRGTVTRERLLTDLWPETPPRDAANYFHQVKNKLEAALPGLSVPFTAATGTYAIRVEGPRFIWDVSILKRLLSGTADDVLEAIRTYSGGFLLESSTPWAQEVRRELEWSVIKAGLQLMDQWNTAGETCKSLELAQRLRDIEPYNEVLAEYLIVATLQLEGEIAARRTFQLVTAQFQLEFGEIPPRLIFLEAERLSVF